MKKFLSVIAICLTLALVAACGSSSGGGGGSATSGEGSSTNGGDGTSESGGTDGSGGGSVLQKIKDQGYVTVGFSNEAPYAYENDEGELTGAAVEVARAVFKEMGVEVKGKLAKWGQLIPSVKNGKLDVITAGMAINPDRCKQIDFGHPGIVYGEGIAVKKGNPKDIHSYKDIAETGVTVAVLNGGTEIGFLKDAGVPKDQMKIVPNVAAGFSAVKTGRAAVTTATALTVKKTVRSSEGDALEFVKDFEQPDVEGVPSYGAAGFNKDADELRKKYNEVLDKLYKEGKIKEIILSDELPLWGENNLYKPGEDPTTKELCQG
ncbi:MAG TPA: ectoine/hydroxyectoine ABC transporter substrate-binding protein EhuB [Bacillales bacterium]|nr:ectoine/hydroxyectoine ABC transporter substrate-binding protein EhuB [Bacillales bacterium]